MVDIEELIQDTSSEEKLEYLFEGVFPKDQDILLSFFEYNGIEEFKDFMSFGVEDFNQPYSTLETPIQYYPCLLVQLRNFFLAVLVCLHVTG
jgi:hypothetical protein